MLRPAGLYKNQIELAFINVWEDPKYQYYFGGYDRWTPLVGTGDHTNNKQFVSVDSNGELVGYIGYSIQQDIKLAHAFGAMNFTDKSVIFGKDLYRVVDDVFVKYGLRTLAFQCICGNQAEKMYDKLVHRIGGTISAIFHDRELDIHGDLCDVKYYEIRSKDYFAALSSRSKKKG